MKLWWNLSSAEYHAADYCIIVKTSIHRLVDQVEPNKKKNSILACQAQEGNDDND